LTRPILTIEAAAQRLGLHPKTLLRFIHEGRLSATKVGRSWRLSEHELDRFSGVPAIASSGRVARVTTIIDLAPCTSDDARRLTNALQGALISSASGSTQARSVDFAHQPQDQTLKTIIQASAAETVVLLATFNSVLEAL
jgi:excisionase family DNA binding protein